MAYPNYPYPGYQPVPGYYPGPMPDQLSQLRQQNMQPPQPVQFPSIQTNAGPIQPGGPQNSGIIWVGGKGEADSWPIASGCAVALWDSNNPVIYLRQADSTGKPSTKVFDLVERTDTPPAPPAAPQLDLSRYVTIDQLEDILAERLKRPARAPKTKEDTDNG